MYLIYVKSYVSLKHRNQESLRDTLSLYFDMTHVFATDIHINESLWLTFQAPLVCKSIVSLSSPTVGRRWELRCAIDSRQYSAWNSDRLGLNITLLIDSKLIIDPDLFDRIWCAKLNLTKGMYSITLSVTSTKVVSLGVIVHNISKGSNLLILSANAAASVSFRVYVNNLFYNKLIIKYRWRFPFFEWYDISVWKSLNTIIFKKKSHIYFVIYCKWMLYGCDRM